MEDEVTVSQYGEKPVAELTIRITGELCTLAGQIVLQLLALGREERRQTEREREDRNIILLFSVNGNEV